MNKTFINGKKLPIVIGISLVVLVIAASFSIFIGQVQAAPAIEISAEGNSIRSGYCSASRSLVHKAIRQRLDFALSDGRGNALGLREGAGSTDQEVQEVYLQRMDFSLSDGRGNALGLRDGSTAPVTFSGEMILQRLDFALSDGRGNGLGLRDGSSTLASSVLAAICP